MKIAINGEIIDTKDIYKISKVVVGSKVGTFQYFSFDITLFNKIKVVINQDIELFLDRNSSLKSCKMDLFLENGGFELLKENATNQDLIEHPIYVDALNKINNLRDGVIKIWSENQSEIPQFNIE